MNGNYKKRCVALVVAMVLLAVAAIGLMAGCGSGRSIAGTWTFSADGSTTTMVANANGSFEISDANGKKDGTWHMDGNTVVIYPDTRNGGGPEFGDAWDGSYRYQLNAAGDQMSLLPIPGKQPETIVFVKKATKD